MSEEIVDQKNDLLERLESIITENQFKDVSGKVESEISKIESLQNRLISHADKLLTAMEDEDESSKPKRMGTKEKKKPSGIYVAQQISNVVSLGGLKSTLFNQLAKLRSEELDRRLRILNNIAKHSGDDADLGVPPDQLAAFVMSLLQSGGKAAESYSGGRVIEVEGESIDDILNSRLKEEGVEALDVKAISSGETKPEHIKNKESDTEIDEDVLRLKEEEDDDMINQDKSLDELVIKNGYRLFYSEEEERFIITDEEMNIVRYATEDELELEEVEENVYMSSVIKLQLELIDESNVEEDDD
ncbi:g169 [Yersinia phage phiR1-37]|uniref:hypothetical protein n=1 Tax=Yersinia phage phiR1-37 TaxID=331278 RepID=UPI00022DBD55|nr:hypothetical protein phiR1-37_gp169 [Yersinia phage phiR1-37]CCE26193.1 g169 [Yersinia phage phiR1-37]